MCVYTYQCITVIHNAQKTDLIMFHLILHTYPNRGNHVAVSVKNGNWHSSLKAPDPYQLVTAANSKQRVACIARNVSDLGCMTTHCTQQTASLSTPHLH